MSDNKSTPNIYQTLKRLAVLYIDNAKLTAAEKLTMLLSGIAFFSIVLVLCVLALIFVAIGISNLLEAYLEPFWTYFIMAGLIVAVAAALVVLKEQLIINPIARFISKLFIDAPVEKSKNTNDQDATK